MVMFSAARSNTLVGKSRSPTRPRNREQPVPHAVRRSIRGRVSNGRERSGLQWLNFRGRGRASLVAATPLCLLRFKNLRDLSHSLPLDHSFVSRVNPDFYLDRVRWDPIRESICPFDRTDCRLAEIIVKADLIQLALVLQPIEIHM
jgi:hypothetical protein